MVNFVRRKRTVRFSSSARANMILKATAKLRKFSENQKLSKKKNFQKPDKDYNFGSWMNGLCVFVVFVFGSLNYFDADFVEHIQGDSNKNKSNYIRRCDKGTCDAYNQYCVAAIPF